MESYFTQHNENDSFSSVIHYFLLLDIGISSYVYTAVCLSIPLLMDVWGISSTCLWQLQLQWDTFICISLYRYSFWFLLSNYLRVDWLNHAIGVCFNLQRSCHTVLAEWLNQFVIQPAVFTPVVPHPYPHFNHFVRCVAGITL
jgi:hypothetical protein